jgi:hypothetical protein
LGLKVVDIFQTFLSQTLQWAQTFSEFPYHIPKSFYYFFFDGPSILEPKTGDKKPLFRFRLAVLEPVFYAEIQALGNLTRLRCGRA